MRCSLVLEKPLLVRGGHRQDPAGRSRGQTLDMPLITWHVKARPVRRRVCTTTTPCSGCTTPRFGDHDVRDIREHIHMGALGRAFQSSKSGWCCSSTRSTRPTSSSQRPAARTRPDALHRHGDRRRGGSRAPSGGRHHQQRGRELPDAFLRRCIFHYIDFPDREPMARIVDVHHPGLDRDLLDQALSAFFAVRGMDRIRKPRAPANSSTGSPCCKPPGSTPWTSTTPVPGHAVEEGAGHGGLLQPDVRAILMGPFLPRVAVSAARAGRRGRRHGSAWPCPRRSRQAPTTTPCAVSTTPPAPR